MTSSRYARVRRRAFRRNVTSSSTVPWLQLDQRRRDELRAAADTFTDDALRACWESIGAHLDAEDLEAFAHVCSALGIAWSRGTWPDGWRLAGEELVRRDRRLVALVVLSVQQYLEDRRRFDV